MYSFDAANGDREWFVNMGQIDGWASAVGAGLVFALTGQNSPTVKVDLATHSTVWSYPATGRLALSNQGLLLITVEDRVIALDCSGGT